MANPRVKRCHTNHFMSAKDYVLPQRLCLFVARCARKVESMDCFTMPVKEYA